MQGVHNIAIKKNTTHDSLFVSRGEWTLVKFQAQPSTNATMRRNDFHAAEQLRQRRHHRPLSDFEDGIQAGFRPRCCCCSKSRDSNKSKWLKPSLQFVRIPAIRLENTRARKKIRLVDQLNAATRTTITLGKLQMYSNNLLALEISTSIQRTISCLF